jgi:hypothetical protein
MGVEIEPGCSKINHKFRPAHRKGLVSFLKDRNLLTRLSAKARSAKVLARIYPVAETAWE